MTAHPVFIGPLDAAESDPNTSLWWHLIEGHRISFRSTQGNPGVLHALLHEAPSVADHEHPNL